MSTKTYTGSCHCGQVKFEADLDIAKGTSKCNCTICWKRRYWGVSAKPEAFRALAGAKVQSQGERGGFCRECGVLTFQIYNTDGWGEGFGGDRVSINVASLDDLDLSELLKAPVTFCDGRADNWWNPPAETRHL